MKNDWLIEDLAREERSVIAVVMSLALLLAAYLVAMPLAFYAGWPSSVTAVSVAKEVFEKK
jgi:hypothetical protein